MHVFPQRFSTIGHLMRIIDGVSHSEAATPRDCEVYQLFIQPLAVKSPFLWQPRNSGHFRRDLDDCSMFLVIFTFTVTLQYDGIIES